MIIRKATEADLQAVADIYLAVQLEEEAGRMAVGWRRGIYPTEETARAALLRDDLFVGEADGAIVGTAIINKNQVDVYSQAAWEFPAPDEEVMVLHTLAIAPWAGSRGHGRQFARFYEDYALEHGCHYLRIDTNTRNTHARAMYARWGYKEVSIIPCTFNGIGGVNLVLLEKRLP